MVEIVGETSQIPNFTLNQIRNKVGLKDYEKGESYYLTKAVIELNCQGLTLRGSTKGTAPEPYREWISFDSRGIADSYCSCPVGGKGTCKHVAAVLLTFKMLQSNDKLIVDNNLGKPKSPTKTVTIPAPSSSKTSTGRFSAFGFESPKKTKLGSPSEKVSGSNNDDDMDTTPSSNISSVSGTPEDIRTQNVQLKAANKWLFLLVRQYQQNNTALQQKLEDTEMKFDLECEKSQKLAKQIKSIKNEKMVKLNKELTFLSNIANAFKIKLDALTQIATVNPASNPPSQHSTPNVIKPAISLLPNNDNELKFSQPSDSFEEELTNVLVKTEMDYKLQKDTTKATEEPKTKPSENTFLESQEVPAFQEAVSSLLMDEMRNKGTETSEPEKKRKRTLLDVMTSGSPEPSMDITTLLTQGSSNDNTADKDLSNLIAKYISPTKDLKKQQTETEFEKLFLKKKNEE